MTSYRMGLQMLGVQQMYYYIYFGLLVVATVSKACHETCIRGIWNRFEVIFREFYKVK